MLSFVKVRDVKSAALCLLKIVNNKTKTNMTCVSSHRCLGSLVFMKKEFRLNKITDFICWVNHGIFPPNM